MRDRAEYNGSMIGVPDRSLRVARRAAGRIAAARLVRSVGRSLVVGGAAGVVAAAAAALAWGTGPGLIAAGACLTAGALFAVVFELLRARPVLTAAARVDDALGLKDRLSSAIEFGRGDGGDPFVALAVADAERHAGDADVRRVVAVRASRAWAVWPVLGAAAVGAALVVPMLPRGGRVAADPERVARTRESISATAAELEEEVLLAPEAEAAQQDALDRMREIERQLAEGLRTPEEAATEAAAVVEDAAERLEMEARAERSRGLRERLEGIKPEEVGGAAALAEALREDDLEGARRALREIARRGEGGSGEERERLAEDLRRLAEQIRSEQGATPDGADEEAGAEDLAADAVGDDADADSGGGDGAAEPLDDAEPAEPSLPPSPEQAAEERNSPESADEPGDALTSPGGDEQPVPGAESPDAGERPSTPDQAAREQVERGARGESEREEGRREAEELADRLDEVADGVEEPSERQSQPPADPNETGSGGAESEGEERPPGAQGQTERGGSEQGEASDDSPEGRRETADDAPNGAERGADAPGEGEDAARPGESGRDAPAEDQPEGGAREPGTSPDAPASEGHDRPGEGAPGGQGDSDRAEDGSRGAGSSDAAPSGEARDDPANADAAAGENGDRTEGGSTEDGRQGETELDRAMDQLQKMDREQRESLRKMAQSEKLRQRARELLEDAAPEQRQRLADLADRLAHDSPVGAPLEGWDPETEVFDARSPEPDKGGANRQVGSAEPGGAPQAGGERFRSVNSAAEVREAAAAAEQAIEGQAIPRRYRDYVRQVYRRFEEAAGGAAPEGRDAGEPGAGAGG